MAQCSARRGLSLLITVSVFPGCVLSRILQRSPQAHRGSHTAASPRSSFGCWAGSFWECVPVPTLAQSPECCECSGRRLELARGHKHNLKAPSVLTLVLFAPRFPRGWAPQPPRSHPRFRNESLARPRLGWDEVMRERRFSIASCYKTEGSVSEVVQYVRGHRSNGVSTRH